MAFSAFVSWIELQAFSLAYFGSTFRLYVSVQSCTQLPAYTLVVKIQDLAGNYALLDLLRA